MVPADPGHLARLRHAVELWAARLELSPRTVSAIVEAGPARRLHPGHAALRITVTDCGTWQDHADPQCGQGLPLIRVLTDDSTITTEPGRTVVALRWSLHDEAVSWRAPVPG